MENKKNKLKFKQKITTFAEKHKTLCEIIRFAIVGGGATLVDMFFMGVTLYIFQPENYPSFFNVFYGATLEPSSLSTIIGTAVGFIFGLIFNYILSVIFVFTTKGKSKSAKGFLLFSVLSTIGLGLHVLGMFLGFDLLGINEWIVKIIMTAIVLVYNYITRKIFIFKDDNFSSNENLTTIDSGMILNLETTTQKTEKLKMRNNILYVVVPCYNEEEVLHETAKRLKVKMNSLIESKQISDKSRIMFVNDGSKDKTWEIIKKLNKEDKLFKGVTLSRNRGHQNALLAGLTTANKYADITISMDADLQDDIDAIDGMLKAYHEGYDVVYGVRSSRKKDTKFKKGTAEAFYKIMKKMGVDTVFNHADYRLLSKNALDGVLQFKESNLFLRGIVPQVGYKSTTVEYERAERFAGESKYPLKKMLNFAIDGITSFSIKPLFIILTLGIVFCMLGFIATVTTIVLMFAIHLSSLWVILSFITLMTGIILGCLGLVGIYVGKSYMETKQRPRFIIEEELD